MKANKIIAVSLAGVVAVALFGLSFSAVLVDGEGVLRATSVGLLAGLAGFLGTALIVTILAEME